MADNTVYESLRLYVTPEKYIIEPLDETTNELLIIDRVSQEISLQSNDGQIPSNVPSYTICGIMGIIRLLAGPYLIVITRKTLIGQIHHHTIWKVAETDILSYPKTTLHLTEKQIQDNKIYLTMIQTVLQTDGYYFSTSFDITHTLQRLHNTSPDFQFMSLYERADQRFVWNGHLLRELAALPELNRYVLPVLHGFVSIVRQCTINQIMFDWILISRRSCFRAGTRYYMRGLDGEGHAANYVETEQILMCRGDCCSFVQTRGSIPVYWSQRPNLRYKPTPVLNNAQNHLDGFKRHFHNQIYNYGDQVVINLIDHKGAEDLLEKTLDDTVKKSQIKKIRYESFDFHHECRRMRWENLSILMNRLTKEQEAFGYFMVLQDGTVIKQQTGVFRTNCIDCLDRTNVVQSLLARRGLQRQMEELKILHEGQHVEDQSIFENIYKNKWADNADACSLQYTGTGALKTDFTRTGKRTKFGAMKDGLNASIRYYKNNFADGFRQDAIDLFLGNYIVEESEGISLPSPFYQERDWRHIIPPIIFLCAFSMCIISILIPSASFREHIAYIIFWAIWSVLTLVYIIYYGHEFVDKPQLTQAKKSKYE